MTATRCFFFFFVIALCSYLITIVSYMIYNLQLYNYFLFNCKKYYIRQHKCLTRESRAKSCGTGFEASFINKTGWDSGFGVFVLSAWAALTERRTAGSQLRACACAGGVAHTRNHVWMTIIFLTLVSLSLKKEL